MKKKSKKKRGINSTKVVATISSIAVGLSLAGIAYYSYFNFKTVSELKSVEIKDNMKNDNKMTMEITLEPNKYVKSKDTWCAVAKTDNEKNISWVKAKKE